MKKIKFFHPLAEIIAIISVFTLTCTNIDELENKEDNTCTKASAPTNVNAESASTSSIRVTWSSVGDAIFYTVYRTKTPDAEYLSVGRVFDLSFTDTALTQATTYYYRISAQNDCGEGNKSIPTTATIKPTDISNDHYLGYGYDVINSSYINRSDVKISHPILDQRKMAQDAVVVSEAIAGKQDFQMFAGSNLTQFYKDRNAGMSVNLDYSWVLFSGKFSLEFSVAINENRIDSNSYIRGRSYRYTQDDYIKGATPQKLAAYLTNDFISVLQTKTASQILDQYGTHVLVRYYKGGSLEFNYAYNGKNLSNDDTRQLKSALQASYKGITGEISGSATEISERRELEENSIFHYYTYGGKPIDAFTVQELKKSYGDWLNSIADNADICGIGDFNQSLIPLWELAAANGASSIAQKLENEFNAQAVKQGKALLVKKIKTAREEFNLESTANHTYYFDKIAKNSPAEVEIYVLGAGGGGQGGDYNNGLFSDKFGTGGGGGGGEVAFVKMLVEEPISFTITLGYGGGGGNSIITGVGGTNTVGCKGGDGGNTKVEWSAEGKNFCIVAMGGKGGGNGGCIEGVAGNTNGGIGGAGGYVSPSSDSHKKTLYVTGNNGWTGSIDSDWDNEGGAGAKLEEGDGNSESFGGSPGGRRNGQSDGTVTRWAGYGGGGSGGYGKNSGASGGKGFAVIKIKYYVDEE